MVAITFWMVVDEYSFFCKLWMLAVNSHWLLDVIFIPRGC